MRLIAISDTHGSTANFLTAIEKYNDADMFMFLGDGFAEYENAVAAYPDKKIYGVNGNCDFLGNLPDYRVINAGGKLVLMTHGHRFHVKSGLGVLRGKAALEKASIVLFGHTHVPTCEHREGIWMVNPGSSAYSCKVAVIDINGDKIDIKLETVYDE